MYDRFEAWYQGTAGDLERLYWSADVGKWFREGTRWLVGSGNYAGIVATRDDRLVVLDELLAILTKLVSQDTSDEYDFGLSFAGERRAEIQRLISAFAVEAEKFHDISFSTFLVSQEGATSDRRFSSPNHTIMLWQYYGAIQPDGDVEQVMTDLHDSDLQWGLRGAALSSFAVLEGPASALFVRMAKRAGSLFDKKEARAVNLRVLDDIMRSESAKDPSSKPTAATNSNPLAIWLNYLLYHLSMTRPGREHYQRIEPDPFTLSLLALERLARDPTIGRIDKSASPLKDLRFKVAMSFPGERRAFVSRVVDALRPALGTDTVFYDHDYQAQLARPNMDTLLQSIYRNNSDLIVVFLCEEYAQKQWCGLEWRAIRDIIKVRGDDRVMFVRFDNANVDGVFSIDGYIDGNAYAEHEVAKFILQRLATLPSVGKC